MKNRLRRLFGSARALLYVYFLVLIAVSTVLLALPHAWPRPGAIGALDALFTATSAAAVTGLITVNTADFTLFGQLVILVTIQLGGLGIIFFSTVFLIQPALKMSLRNRSLIREYYVDQVDFDPARIIRSIVAVVITVQAAGALMLFAGFMTVGAERPLLNAMFHAVSAFNNAGFSLFADSLERFVGEPAITVPVMLLVVLGGIGFVVLIDLLRKSRGGRAHRLTLHTNVVLSVTVMLLVAAAAAYFVFERNGAYTGLSEGEAGMAALFQAITPRTAGFNTVPQEALGYPARTLTKLLMFIGGAPGSIAGGIKVTTFALVLVAALFGTNRDGDLEFAERRIPAELLAKAHALLFKALLLLFVSVVALTISERGLLAGRLEYSDLLFEAFSAFGTVGLSTGVTPHLSAAGRIIIIVTMFAGRVGLIAFAMPRGILAKPRVGYPTGEVIVG